MAGLLDQSLGPILTTWSNLPIYGKIGVAVAAGVLFLLYKWFEGRSEDDQLEATDWEEKWEQFLKVPAEETGRPEKTLLLNQSDSAGKRTMGVIKKLSESDTNIGGNELEAALGDNEKWEELKDEGKLVSTNVTYVVVPGRKKLDRLINTVLYKLAGVISKGSNPQAEYFDLPLSKIKVTDQGVVVKKGVHLFKKDGLWQTDTVEGQHRLMQLSALSTHQNWLESLQKHPEFYSDLNMNVSGEKNIMNQKSKNMREYKEAEKKQEKKDAMN